MAMTSESSQDVSVIGLGAMGFKIAQLLLRRGHNVTVWNRTGDKSTLLVREGATLALSAAAAIRASAITIICVSHYKAADAILKNEEVASVLAGRVLIQMTTGTPQEAREAQSWAKEHGAEYLDGAIQVAPDQMARPDTTILLSGAKTVFERSEPILGVLGGNLTYLGESIGSASAMDLGIGFYLYGALTGFLHGVLLCETEGLGVDTYGSVIAKVASGYGEFMEHEGEVIHSGDYAASQFSLGLSVEATERLLQAARSARINTTFPTLICDTFRRAADSDLEGEELAAMIKVLRQPV